MPSSPAVFSRRLMIPLLLFSLTGCVGAGTLGDILGGVAGGMGGNNISGELRQVDTRRQTIVVRSALGGNQQVLYDSRTQVMHGQSRYAVRDLRAGDIVRVRGERDRRGNLLARRIDLERMAQAPGRGGARVQLQRLDGTVGRIDTRSGWFELRQSRGGAVTVTMPYGANRSLQDRFRRLRTGHRVSVEGERISQQRLELHRFR
jgi:hypothetical protein